MTKATYALFPPDPSFKLLTRWLWTEDGDRRPTLGQEHLWVRFPEALAVSGVELAAAAPPGRIRVETSTDYRDGWRTLAHAEPDPIAGQGAYRLSWDAIDADNLRIVADPDVPSSFPLTPFFRAVRLLCEQSPDVAAAGPEEPAPPKPFARKDINIVQPFAGSHRLQMFERTGICHERPQTDRVFIETLPAAVRYRTPLFSADFSTEFALIEALGWDTLGRGKQGENLLSAGNTQGAFPVVSRNGRRVSSEAGGGSVAVNGRKVGYRDVQLVPELTLSYDYELREAGFSVTIGWKCAESFVTDELALLRLPFDLYRSVTAVLALPKPAGPAGLVRLPLVVNSPNYGTMRVTAVGGGAAGVYARVTPFRVHAELWLDIIAGAVPLRNGLFEMVAGEGSVELTFELTKIFPLGNRDKSSLFMWWEMPPFYSFADRENVLGALPNAWLNGIGFRPELGRFANNSVADSAGISAFYYAELAAYTPELAPGLSPRELIRFGAEQLLFEKDGNVYSNHKEFPNAVTSLIDCVWLYVASTGDWAWAGQVKEAFIRKANRLLELEHPASGLVASAFSGVPTDPGQMSCSWPDSLRSGHLESYVNAHAFRSLRRAAEITARLGETEAAAGFRALSDKIEANFLRVFHDEASGQIMQWVDVNGAKYGFRSRMHLGAAIVCGLMPVPLARQLLRDYLDRLQASGFTACEYGLPLFLEPIPAECHNGWKGKGVERDGSDQLGVYQNGAMTHLQCYYLLQALYRTGMRREANELFAKLSPAARNGGLCGGLHSGVDWRRPDGSAAGYEGLLAEQYHYLLASITGYLGVELTIDGFLLDAAARASGSDRMDGIAERLQKD